MTRVGTIELKRGVKLNLIKYGPRESSAPQVRTTVPVIVRKVEPSAVGAESLVKVYVRMPDGDCPGAPETFDRFQEWEDGSYNYDQNGGRIFISD